MKGGSPEVLAVVKDLFFVARIRETARLAGVPLVIARTVDEVETSVNGPRLLLLDLTGGFDYARIFDAAERAGVPVLAFTTHALARETQPWHARCARARPGWHNDREDSAWPSTRQWPPAGGLR